MDFPDWFQKNKKLIALNLIALTTSPLYILLGLLASIFLAGEALWLTSRAIAIVKSKGGPNNTDELRFASIKRSFPYFCLSWIFICVSWLIQVGFNNGVLPLFK